jgi:hypothetical protein
MDKAVDLALILFLGALASRKKDDLEKRVRETMKDEKRARRAERKTRKAT